MDQYSVAAVGIADKDLTVLKSLLNLVSGPRGISWQLVADPAQAHIAFLGHLPADRIRALVAELGRRVVLVYCCSRGEAPPEQGVMLLDHCPPRANELAQVFAAVADRQPAERVAVQPERAQPLQLFEAEHCLAGAIHGLLPRLLIDQPLAVSVPGAPCLLIDVHAGVRTVHADPAWFARPDFWRVDPRNCRLDTTIPPEVLAECRRFPARPYQALRFWGLMSASLGAPIAELAHATEVGLKKTPEFKILPHLDWQPRLAEGMVGRFAAPDRWAAAIGRQIGEVFDFLNACSGVGLLKTA